MSWAVSVWVACLTSFAGGLVIGLYMGLRAKGPSR